MKCSAMGPRESAGKKVSAPTMSTTLTSRPDEERAVGGEGPGPGGHGLLADHRAGDAHHRDDHQEAAQQHVEARVVFHKGVLALSPAKAEPLFPAPLV